MTENMDVTPLAELASGIIVHECWRCGGLVELLADYHRKKQMNEYVTDHRPRCSAVINDILRQILAFKLPKLVKYDIANKFLEFERDARTIAKLIVSSIIAAPVDYIRHSLKGFVLTPSGKIDKQMTLISLVLRQILTYVSPKYTGYYCIKLERVRRIVRELHLLGGDTCQFPRFYLETIFPRPDWYWQQRSESTIMTLFLCCATRGPVEAMEYFLPTLQADEKEQELSRAASHLVHRRAIDVEKLWFFYKNMEPSTWQSLLRRHFSLIMRTVLSSHRYRVWAVHFYSQVSESVHEDSVAAVLDHISEQNLSDLESQPGGTYLADLLLGDLEPVFYSIWEKMPTNTRQHVTVHIKKYINRFLYRNRFNIIRSLIEHEAFNENDQLDLAYHVVMTLIVTNKQSYIDEFLSTLSTKPHLDRESIKNGYLTYYTLRQFVVSGDSCQNIDNYNTLLQTKHTDGEISRIKHQLLNDSLLMEKAVDAVKHQVLTIKNFHDLVLWCCCNDVLSLNRFVARSLKLIATLFKNQLLYRKTSFNTGNPFSITERHMQRIKMYIMQDHDALKEYCVELMRTKNYSAVTTMLTDVFENSEDRSAFLRDFFRSPSGYDAIDCLISEHVFDESIHYEYDFDMKVTHFIEFKKHWVLTNDIMEDIEIILDDYVIPEMEDRAEKQDLLPHESSVGYKNVCEENWQAMRVLLRQSDEDFRRYSYNEEEY